jgi:outer membrane immunogenic protein
VKGGGACERDRYDIYNGPLTTQPGLVTASTTNSRCGWTGGAGFEYAFWQRLSAFIEADYYDMGTRQTALTSTLLTTTLAQSLYDIRERKTVVKVGVNYNFNFGQPAVIAKYLSL